MVKNIKEIALEVERVAKERGFTSIEPNAELIKVSYNNEKTSHLDFVLRKGNHFAGRAHVLVKNQDVKTQTVEQVSGIEIEEI